MDFNILHAEELPKKVEKQEQLTVERVSGFAGFGLPSSHIKSKGEVLLSDLSPEDLRIVDALFQTDVQLSTPKTDGFLYRLTRKKGNSLQTIEVPEENVPVFIQNCVKDTLE